MVYTCNPSFREAEEDCHKFKASLNYITGSRPARATQQELKISKQGIWRDSSTINCVGYCFYRGLLQSVVSTHIAYHNCLSPVSENLMASSGLLWYQLYT